MQEQHNTDEHGIPDGGQTTGLGLTINWQRGTMMVDGVRQETPNGCFVETVIEAALGRLQYFQGTKFSCRENALAITKLEEALHWLDHRKKGRQARNVEGTHEV